MGGNSTVTPLLITSHLCIFCLFVCFFRNLEIDEIYVEISHTLVPIQNHTVF